MGFKKRISEQTELVSQFDDVFVLGFTEEQQEEYRNTLDIKKLGDFSDMTEKPAVFRVDPLKPKFEYMAFSHDPDTWGIFAAHVKEIRNAEVELTFQGENIDPVHRAEIPARIVQDIASMIVALCNKSGDDYFFTPSVASLHYGQRVKARHAAKKMESVAALAGAISKPTQ